MKQLLLLIFFPLTIFAQTNCDILVRNGKIIDGAGNSWYYGDVAVKNGKIIAVGRQLNFTGAKTIDATGLIVSPGFIDVHTHLESDETKDPTATNFILDGVTTCITGNCGSSNTDIGKYLRYIDSLKLSINVATLIGQNDVRKQVMGRANRDATAEELEQMKNIVDKAMREGAVGFSTGLIYIPGTYTKTPEIVELAKVAAKYNGVYATHMRDEGDSVVFAINEALTVGREAKIPVEISHFKLSGQQNWGRSKETVPMVSILNTPSQISNKTGHLYYLARFTPRLKPLSTNNRTFEQLKNSGNFRLIRNLGTSNKIMTYYEKFPLIHLLESVNEAEFNEYKKVAAKIFDPAVFLAMEGNTDEIKRTTENPPLRTTNTELLQELSIFSVYMHGTKKGIVGAAEELKTTGSELIEYLQKEYHME